MYGNRPDFQHWGVKDKCNLYFLEFHQSIFILKIMWFVLFRTIINHIFLHLQMFKITAGHLVKDLSIYGKRTKKHQHRYLILQG